MLPLMAMFTGHPSSNHWPSCINLLAMRRCVGPMRQHDRDVITCATLVHRIRSSIVPHAGLTTPIADSISMSPMGIGCSIVFCFCLCTLHVCSWPLS
jgi:hypothetical protein